MLVVGAATCSSSSAAASFLKSKDMVECEWRLRCHAECACD